MFNFVFVWFQPADNSRVFLLNFMLLSLPNFVSFLDRFVDGLLMVLGTIFGSFWNQKAAKMAPQICAKSDIEKRTNARDITEHNRT